MSHEIVGQIKAAILTRRIAQGDRLPAERDLAEQFGVSRVTVRDALRMLEAAGLVEIRVGARGGAIVTAPDAARVGDGIANMMVLSNLTPAHVTEARMAVELGAIPLVCARATGDDIADLRDICHRSEAAVSDGTFSVGLSAEFHTRLSRATHNPAVEMMVDALRVPLLMWLQRAGEVTPGMGHTGVREHRVLVEAIAERDVERAQRIMAGHLSRTADRLVSMAAAS